MKEHFYKTNSQNRLELYQKGELNFDEMLELYSSCDIPWSQKNWYVFWSDFVYRAPKHSIKEPVKLYRGTSIETYEKYGYGYCWTRNKIQASFFAKLCCSPRYRLFGTIDKNPLILELEATPEMIIFDHTNDRGENEVFVDVELGQELTLANCNEFSERMKLKIKIEHFKEKMGRIFKEDEKLKNQDF